MRKSRKTALVVYSGGLDSTTALYWAKTRYERVVALSFKYGANHNEREYGAAKAHCRALGVELTRIDLGFIGKTFKSSLLEGAKAVPDGHYAERNMKSTVVPFRNGIMLSVAAGFAESNGCSVIVLGNHAGDHFIYPDCRPDFTKAMRDAVRFGTAKHIEFVSPFCDIDKAEVVRIGHRLGVDYSRTYSCYKGGKAHCGKCGTCVERKEAFEKAGVPDPTRYLK